MGRLLNGRKNCYIFYQSDNHFDISFPRMSTTQYKEEKNLRNIEEKHTMKLGTIRQIVRLPKGDNTDLCPGNSLKANQKALLDKLLLLKKKVDKCQVSISTLDESSTDFIKDRLIVLLLSSFFSCLFVVFYSCRRTMKNTAKQQQNILASQISRF